MQIQSLPLYLLLLTLIPLRMGAYAQETSSFTEDGIAAVWEGGQHKEAHKQVGRWMKVAKDNPEPWVASARLRFLEGKYKGALSHGEAAIKRSSRYAPAYFWRGRAYEALKNYLEAGNEFRAALVADPNFKEAQVGLDRVTALMGSASIDNK